MELEWISTKKEFPVDGEPVLIKARSVFQHIVYELDSVDGEGMTFRPFYFGSDDDLNIPGEKVTHWIYADNIN